MSLGDLPDMKFTKKNLKILKKENPNLWKQLHDENKIPEFKSRTTPFSMDATWAFDCECTVRGPITKAYLICAAKLSDLRPENVKVFYEIGDFLDFVTKKERDGNRFYAHNLTYDASFILAYLRDHCEGMFDTENVIATPEGKIMAFTLKWFNSTKRAWKFKFYDSYIKFHAPLAKVAKAYTDKQKGDTPIFDNVEDIVITEYTVDYCKNDVIILGEALPKIMAIGDKISVSSDSFACWAGMERERLVKEEGVDPRFAMEEFEARFPPTNLAVDKLMRVAYRGGLTFLNPDFKGRILHNITVFDVNSMYPAHMRNKLLPYGYPKPVLGRVECDAFHRVGIQRIRYRYARVRWGKLPFVPTTKGFFGANQYDPEIFPSEGEEFVEDCMTLIELELFQRYYDIKDIEYIGGWKFKASDRSFRSFVDKFMIQKKNPDSALSAVAKLILNSLYGKFAESPYKDNMKFDFSPEGVRAVPETTRAIDNAKELIVTFEEHYKLDRQRKRIDIPEDLRHLRPKGYLPIGIFVTSYARVQLLESIDAIGFENFVYCDTDSMHVTKDADTSRLRIHKDELGAWKCEGTFTSAHYIRAKRYMGLLPDGTKKIACAGINKKDLEKVVNRPEDFVEGLEIPTQKVRHGQNGMMFVPQITRI